METQIKAQLRVQLRGWLERQLVGQGQPAQRLDIVATLLSWSIYGAAIEWRTRAGQPSADAFADEVVPLLVATVSAVNCS